PAQATPVAPAPPPGTTGPTATPQSVPPTATPAPAAPAPAATPPAAALTPAPTDQTRRYETQGLIGPGEQDKARQGVGDRTFAQLKDAGLLPADAKLDSALPADVQKRVDGDAHLKAANPKNYG